MNNLIYWSGVTFISIASLLLALVILIALWFRVIAPAQRTVVAYLFLRKNKQYRHEMLSGLSEWKVFVKIAKGEFESWTSWDSTANGDRYGFRINSIGLIGFWICEDNTL